jgi:hypothetical protein
MAENGGIFQSHIEIAKEKNELSTIQRVFVLVEVEVKLVW